MSEPTNLELFQKKQARSKKSMQDEMDIFRVLHQRAELKLRWTSGKEICELLQWPAGESSRRRIRKVAEGNSKRLLTGDLGYCLLAHAEPGEVKRAVARLRSHGEKEIKRSVDLANAYHHYAREHYHD